MLISILLITIGSIICFLGIRFFVRIDNDDPYGNPRAIQALTITLIGIGLILAAIRGFMKL